MTYVFLGPERLVDDGTYLINGIGNILLLIIETINMYFKNVYPSPLLQHTDGQTFECVYLAEFELHATHDMFMGNTWFKRG